MRRLIPLALLLAGCAAEDASQPHSFRDQTVPIASTSRFDPARFAGEWRIVADYTPQPTCAPVQRFDPGPRPGTLTYHFCPERAGPGPFDIAYDPEGSVLTVAPYGRLQTEGPPIWVLWVAEDFGTAVIGTPSGSFGRILNRGPSIRPDRLKAAREVLAFNGYDLSRLKTVAR